MSCLGRKGHSLKKKPLLFLIIKKRPTTISKKLVTNHIHYYPSRPRTGALDLRCDTLSFKGYDKFFLQWALVNSPIILKFLTLIDAQFIPFHIKIFQTKSHRKSSSCQSKLYSLFCWLSNSDIMPSILTLARI